MSKREMNQRSTLNQECKRHTYRSHYSIHFIRNPFKRSFTFFSCFLLPSTVPINRNKASVTRITPNDWADGNILDISWDRDALGDQDHSVSIELARYVREKDKLQLHSYHTVVDSQQNTGSSQFAVTSGEGDG